MHEVFGLTPAEINSKYFLLFGSKSGHLWVRRCANFILCLIQFSVIFISFVLRFIAYVLIVIGTFDDHDDDDDDDEVVNLFLLIRLAGGGC